MNLRIWSCSLLIVLPLLLGPIILGAPTPPENPDFTRGGQLPDKPTDWNLGPTGARGWMHAWKGATSDARQIFITQVDAGSPADGLLRKGDVLLGINGKPFTRDARITLARSITIAEALDGKLPLVRWRDGKSSPVVIPLAPLGAYSPTAPWRCRKSARILKQGCQALAERMRQENRRDNPIIRCQNALALLASGDPAYLPLIRDEITWANAYEISEGGLYSWYSSWVNLLLAEYLLATGDNSVQPSLERLSRAIADGQSRVGTWGHRFAYKSGILRGYGAMNQPGLALTLSLVAAREAGVDDPAVNRAIETSRRYFSFYVNKGAIPYGDHHPWLQMHDDNGKCSAAAILFDQLGDMETSAFFSRMATSSYGIERETGHTGNFFNMLWALPGVARSGPNATGAWIRESGWMLDLARKWDYSFTYLGIPDAHNSYKNWDCTGAYLLGYAVAGGHIRFCRPNPRNQLEPSTVKGLIRDGRGWTPRDKAKAYETLPLDTLIMGLSSWSPVVRQRSANALGKRDEDVLPQVMKRLSGTDVNAQLGACAALEALGGRAKQAVPQLAKLLHASDPWVQVQAAEALTTMGEAASPAIPAMLELVAAPPTADDPRGMVQRYVGFALFYRGRSLGARGLLHNSWENQDRARIIQALTELMQNDDGRVRSTAASALHLLQKDELERMLPAIYTAVSEPAPSGVMFADGIRNQGLEMLARQKISDGLPWCIDFIEPDRWGADSRFSASMKALKTYGAAAAPLLPALRALEKECTPPRSKHHKWLQDLQSTITHIETAENDVSLRPLPSNPESP